MNRNYYDILGITNEERKLSGEEFSKVVKKKYYKLSKEYHPDMQTDKSDEDKKKAEDMFRKVTEAYDTLSDENKRYEYDNPRTINDLSDIMNAMRNMHFYGGESYEMSRGSNIRINLETTLKDAYIGAKRSIKYKYNCACKTCGCTGIDKNVEPKICDGCGGTGEIVEKVNMYHHIHIHCGKCGGTGRLFEPCKECGGKGVTQKDETVDIIIPQGCANGYRTIIKNKGCESTNGGERGDLLVMVVVAQSMECSDGSIIEVVNGGVDLSTVVKVTIIDLLCGCTKKVELPDGKNIEFRIRECSNPSSIMRVNGKGLVGMNGQQGNLLIGFYVEMPTSIGEETKTKLESIGCELYNTKKEAE